VQLTLEALQLLANAQLISFKVDILPAQTQHLAAAPPIASARRTPGTADRVGRFQESQSFG
jgi:hypothetical protein